VAACSKNFVILSCIVLTGLKGLIDGRTDTSTMAKMREALRAVARKNPAGAHAAFIALHRLSLLDIDYELLCL